MIVKKYWNLVYVVNKVKYAFKASKYNQAPWLTFNAVDFLDKEIKKEFQIFEWGSGRSTFWFSERCNNIVSVEHNSEWFDIVSNKANKKQNILLLKKEEKTEYENSIIEYPDNFFDLVVIDGIRRGECAVKAITKLKRGGMLLIDDAHRYIPSNSIAPYALESWNSQKDKNWLSFKEQTINWEQQWFKDGISDTLILIKQ